MKRITLTLTGEFEMSDLAAFAMLLRTIDKRNPAGHYELLINDPDSSLQEAEARLREIVPPLPGRETTFTVHRKQ